MSGFTFDRQPKYSVLKFTPELSQMAWADVEAATKRVTELVHDDKSNSVLVDLSELDSMPSGIVASLVRTWKGMDERTRKLVVVSTTEKVTHELEQTGLTSLWTLTDNRPDAYRALGVSAPVDAPPEEGGNAPATGGGAFAEASQPVSTEPYGFKETRAFCGVQMNPILMAISWEDMEQATTDVIEKYNASKLKNVLVDVSRMEMINSGLVAALVRVWKATKERKGKFSLVSPNDMVTGVLKSAGLWKLWHVVDDRDEAIYGMGVSSGAAASGAAANANPAATPIAVICAVIAAICTAIMLFSNDLNFSLNAQLLSLLFAAGAVTTGGIAIFKDRGFRRIMGLAALFVGVGVISSILFPSQPIGQVRSHVPVMPRTSPDDPPADDDADTDTAAGDEEDTDNADDETGTDPDDADADTEEDTSTDGNDTKAVAGEINPG